MSRNRTDWVLAGAVVTTLAALLDLVFMTASQTLCQPGRGGCRMVPLWAYVAPWLVVALGLLCSAVVAYVRRGDGD